MTSYEQEQDDKKVSLQATLDAIAIAASEAKLGGVDEWTAEAVSGVYGYIRTRDVYEIGLHFEEGRARFEAMGSFLRIEATPLSANYRPSGYDERIGFGAQRTPAEAVRQIARLMPRYVEAVGEAIELRNAHLAEHARRADFLAKASAVYPQGLRTYGDDKSLDRLDFGRDRSYGTVRISRDYGYAMELYWMTEEQALAILKILAPQA
jgi:hypothetical protein